jgi:hypothetical protein
MRRAPSRDEHIALRHRLGAPLLELLLGAHTLRLFLATLVDQLACEYALVLLLDGGCKGAVELGTQRRHLILNRRRLQLLRTQSSAAPKMRSVICGHVSSEMALDTLMSSSMRSGDAQAGGIERGRGAQKQDRVRRPRATPAAMRLPKRNG